MKHAIACSKYWFIESQKNNIKKFIKITKKNQLSFKKLKKQKIEYIFFPHWSHKIPKKIYENFNCVVFHTGNLPKHRGGSPIQNLIIRGIYKTYVNAIQVTDLIDSGPIYCKENIILKGNLQDIFFDISNKILIMIESIIHKNLIPKKQVGKKSTFKRLKPENSRITKKINNLDKLYDQIRMLDHEDYPRANIKFGNFILSFSEPLIKNNLIKTICTIKKEHKAL